MPRQSLGLSGARAAAAQQQQPTYSFPRLKSSEILHCMHDLNIPLTENELMTANRDAVRRLFEALVETCMGVTREEMLQPAFSGLSALSYAELHEDSIPELAFFRAVTKMMECCGIYNFSYRDLTQPNPKRLRSQLSAVINFAKFREERLALYTEMTAETDALVAERQRVEAENADLQRQLAEMNEAFEEQRPEIEALENECAEMERTINGLNKEQAQLRHDTNQLKAHGSSVREELSAAQLRAHEAGVERDRLAAQVVRSPQRVRRDMDATTAELATATEEVAELERHDRDTQAQLDGLERMDRDVCKATRTIEDMEDEIAKLKKVSKEVKAAQQQILEQETEATELDAQRQSSARQLKRLADKMAELERQSELKQEAAKQALAAAREEQGAVEREQTDRLAELHEMDHDAEAMQRRIADEERRQKEELAAFVSTLKRMSLGVQNYHRGVLSDIGNSVV